MTRKISRREVLTIAAGVAAAGAFVGAPGQAWAANDAQDLIKKFTGGKAPAKGRVKLDLPEIAENGNAVPMTVSVESPMTKESYVSDVLVVAEANPRGGVVTFHFTPASGVAEPVACPACRVGVRGGRSGGTSVARRSVAAFRR